LFLLNHCTLFSWKHCGETRAVRAKPRASVALFNKFLKQKSMKKNRRRATGLQIFWCFSRHWHHDCFLVHRVSTGFLDFLPMLVLCQNPVHIVRVCSPSDWAIIFVFEAHSRYKIHLQDPTRPPTIDRQSSGRFIWHPLHMRLSKTHILTRELFTAANVVVKLAQYQCYTTFCSRAEASDVWVDAGYLRWSRIYAPRYRGRITRCHGTYNVHITIVYRKWKSRREANWG